MQYRRISLFYPIQVFLSNVVVQGTLKTLKSLKKTRTADLTAVGVMPAAKHYSRRRWVVV